MNEGLGPETRMDSPNVLVLMLDQMRWDAVAAHGNPTIRTPSMDELCRRGMTFSNAYTPAPVCVPSRAAFLTGRLPHNIEVYSNETPLVEGAHTFARAARAAGYRTCAIGKMHFEPVRADHGFDEMHLSEEIPQAVSEDDFLQDLLAAGYSHVEEPHGVRHELYYTPQPSQLPEEHHTTAWTGQRTVEFLRATSPTDRPFLCFTSFIKPHPPFDPPSPWHRLYDPLAMADPVREEHELASLTRYQRLQHRIKWVPPDADLLRVRTMKAYYYACISFVDAWIGRIIAALDETSLTKNTLVILTSDHGEYLGDHWAFGKRGFHDGSCKVPLIVAGPGVSAHSVSPALVMLPDVAATLSDLFNDPAVEGMDGASLLEVLSGTRTRHHSWLPGQLGTGPDGLYMAKDEQGKYIYSAPDRRDWYFETIDPREVNDLSESAEHQPQVEVLRQRLQALFRRDGHLAPLDEGGWRTFITPSELTDLFDRDPAGRGRQYAEWVRRDGRMTELASGYVPTEPPVSPGAYQGGAGA